MNPQSLQSLGGQSASIAVIASILLQVFKPLIEKLPFANPAAADLTTHDMVIELSNMVFQGLGLLVVNVAAGTLTPQQLPLMVVQGLLQWATSRSGYHLLNASFKAQQQRAALASLPSVGSVAAVASSYRPTSVAPAAAALTALSTPAFPSGAVHVPLTTTQSGTPTYPQQPVDTAPAPQQQHGLMEATVTPPVAPVAPVAAPVQPAAS